MEFSKSQSDRSRGSRARVGAIGMLPRISVVTISFNQAPYLSACLESVKNQKFGNYEHIVVDACSTDETLDILRRFENEKLSWTSEADSGPADGLNRGFSRSSGEILCYLNADDVLLPDAFSRVVDLFNRYSDADLIYGDGLEVDADGNVVRQLFSSAWGWKQFVYGGCSVVQQSTFFRRDAFMRTRGFNPANRFNWDTELLMDMALAGCKFRHVRENFGAFRVYGESLTGSRRWVNECQLERVRLAEKALGRKLTAFDLWMGKVYRFEKWFRNPRASVSKAFTYWRSRPAY